VGVPISSVLLGSPAAWLLRRESPPSSQVPFAPPAFEANISSFTSEDAKRRHQGPCGGRPQVELIHWGQQGLYAARSTVRIAVPARTIMQWLTTPEINVKIFAKQTARANYRKLLHEDRKAGRYVFESSKTGQWRLFGIPIRHESTVIALEDWRRFEIRYWLKKPGAMKHFSGFWRMIPDGRQETLVLFYHEAVPAFPVPTVLRPVIRHVVHQMASSLLEALSEAARYGKSFWADHPIT